MSATDYAQRELDRLLTGDAENDEIQSMMNGDVLELIDVFSKQGHTGFTAPYCLSLFQRLAHFKPITPLTGEDEEWGPADHKGCQINKRCFNVFRNLGDNSTAVYTEGRVFSDNGGITWYTNRDSHIPVVFPFTVPDKPERVYIEYLEDVPPGYTSDKYEVITDNPERIAALYKRKREEFDEGNGGRL